VRARLLVPILLLSGIALRAEEPCRPDHLTPVDPYPGDWHVRYTDLVHKHLLPPYRFFAAMIVRPSFESEYSVVLHGTKEDYELDWAKTPKVFVSHFAAEKNIWYSMPENNSEKKQKEIKVTTRTTEIPKSLANRVQGLYLEMLKHSRYFHDDAIEVDGTDWEFTAGGMYGQSRLHCTSPALLAHLGLSMMDYCDSAEHDRKAYLGDIEEAVSNLELYFKAHRTEMNAITSNQSMEPTASRRTIQLHMASNRQSAATRALARGDSSCSR
jgi:hypothetical protein